MVETEIIAQIECHEDAGLMRLCNFRAERDAYFNYCHSKPDPFFNRIRKIRVNADRIEDFSRNAEEFYSSFGNSPSFVVNPLTEPIELPRVLIERGYCQHSVSVMIVSSQNIKLQLKVNPNVALYSNPTIEEFVSIFSTEFLKQGEDLFVLRNRVAQNMAENNTHFVARVVEKAVGVVGAISFNDIYSVYGLCVLNEFRKQGIGATLLCGLFNALKEKNPKRIYAKTSNALLLEKAKLLGMDSYGEVTFQKLKK